MSRATERRPGLDLLPRVRELLSDTLTVLVTTFGETDAAIRAINARAADGTDGRR